MLSKNRTTGGYHLASHPQGELTANEVNMLHDVAKIFSLGTVAGNLMIQRFVYRIPAENTTDKTFTDTVFACSVLGGYAKISGADADFDIDIGYTGATTALIDDFNSGENGEKPVVGCYLDTDEDVIITITSNSSTTPIDVEIVLLTVKHVTA